MALITSNAFCQSRTSQQFREELLRVVRDPAAFDRLERGVGGHVLVARVVGRAREFEVPAAAGKREYFRQMCVLYPQRLDCCTDTTACVACAWFPR